MSGGFESELDWEGIVRMDVRWRTERRDVVDYAVTLTALEHGQRRTIRVYDGVHGVNEMHRYTRAAGKQSGIIFHEGTLGEGFRAAQLEVRHGWAEMIEGWRR